MSFSSELLVRNAHFAATAHVHQLPPARQRAIVLSCVDGRADPAHLFGLQAGEALVVRNAGGRVTQEVEEILGVLLPLLGGPGEVVLVHHTDCGAERMADPAVRDQIHARTGVPLASLEDAAIHDHDESLQVDLERLRRSPLVPRGTTVVGLRYDEASGRAQQRLREVLS